MNKEDYTQEGLRQLSDHNFYEVLDEDPTQTITTKYIKYFIKHQI